MRQILLALVSVLISSPAMAEESATDIGLRALIVDFRQDTADTPPDRVMAVYKEACDAGWGPGCDADQWTNGDEVRPDEARAYFQPLCDAGDTTACIAVGWTLTQLPIGTPSVEALFPDRGATYFKRACEKDNARACYELGRLAWDGVGTLRDKQRAASLYEKACEDNIVVSCHRAADLLVAGEFVKGDPERASTFYQKACDFGDLKACDSLGELYRAGRGVERDPAKAVELFDRACKRGQASGCRNMALHYVAKADLKNTVHYYGLGCKAGDGTACADAGKMYESGATGDANAGTRAYEMFERGCLEEEPGSCFAAAQLAEGRLGLKKDSAAVVRLYRDGCENGGGAACGQIAHVTLYGKEGVQRDRAEGVRLARRGCRAGDGWACYLTGVAYHRGWLGERDWSQAAGAYQQACLEGVDQACGPEIKARRKAGLGI